MILYHYTCPCEEHLGSILADGLVRTTESHIGSDRPDLLPYGEHVGPDVVWLTSSKRPIKGLGLTDPGQTGSCDKTVVRITVEVPDPEVHHWPRWSKQHGITLRWRRLWERNQYPDLWYVVERPIPKSDWVSVDFDRTRMRPAGD